MENERDLALGTQDLAEENPEILESGEEEFSKPIEKRCPNCQALLGEDQAFCPECGAPCKKVCPNCNTEIQDGQEFCAGCGQRISMLGAVEQGYFYNEYNRESKAKNKKIIIAVVAAILAVAAVVTYFVVQNIKIKEYKENAETFCMTVLNAAANLEDIGNEIQDEWRDFIYSRWSYYDSVDEAVAGALYNKSDEVNTAKSQKANITQLYQELLDPPSKDLEYVYDAVEVLYDEYLDMYECVIEPSGNYLTFTSNFGDCDTNTVEAYEDLKEICDNFN